MRKAIAIISSNPELAKIFAELEAQKARFDERTAFLARQAEALDKEITETMGPLLEQIKTSCKAQGLLPADYSDEKCHIHIDRDVGLLIACDCGGFLQRVMQGVTG